MHLGGTQEVYTQDADCCSSHRMGHTLTIATEDGGGGPFLLIKTERWSFEDEAEIELFARRLKEHLRRANEIHNEDEAREEERKNSREQAEGVDPH